MVYEGLPIGEASCGIMWMNPSSLYGLIKVLSGTIFDIVHVLCRSSNLFNTTLVVIEAIRPGEIGRAHGKVHRFCQNFCAFLPFSIPFHLTTSTPNTSLPFESSWLRFSAGLFFFPPLVVITTSPQCLGTADKFGCCEFRRGTHLIPPNSAGIGDETRREVSWVALLFWSCSGDCGGAGELAGSSDPGVVKWLAAREDDAVAGKYEWFWCDHISITELEFKNNNALIPGYTIRC